MGALHAAVKPLAYANSRFGECGAGNQRFVNHKQERKPRTCKRAKPPAKSLSRKLFSISLLTDFTGEFRSGGERRTPRTRAIVTKRGGKFTGKAEKWKC
jgi:hypothetical protein